MNRLSVRIEASAAYESKSPAIEVLIGGTVVTSAVVTAQTGIGFDVLNFACDYAGQCPSPLSFRFADDFSEGGRSITLESVTIDGRCVNVTDISRQKMRQNQTSVVHATAAGASVRYLVYSDNLNYTTVSGFGVEKIYNDVQRIAISDVSREEGDGSNFMMGNTGRGCVSIPHRDIPA